MEKSQELNDNRSVYRSQLLLDQDRAVRSANLANIYRDAGMFDRMIDQVVAIPPRVFERVIDRLVPSCPRRGRCR